MVASIQPACLVYRVQMRPAFIHPRIDISGRLANLKASANRSRNHIRFNHARFNSVQQQTLAAAFVADIFGRYPLRLRKWPNSSSGLIVRKLDDIQLVVCAAPDYLRRRGEPATPDDLVEHDCLAFGDVPGVAEWSFQNGALRRSLRIPTRLCANDFETLVSAALAGAGLVRVPSWQVAHCLADGRLRIVLEANQRPPTPLSILTLRTRLLLPKVRAFVDFLHKHWTHPRPPQSPIVDRGAGKGASDLGG